MKYRIKQEGYWFYPQKRRWYGVWVNFAVADSFFGFCEVYFDSYEKAKAWLDDYLRPPPPPPEVKIHPYP